ncbi:MAG: type II toxin-antitoxin system death-on-curing family toxin [Gemmatimonadales bacterium]|nr:type II toxin-antitoxin system death-on-curing family toxin [Gemmatimonadales bacterium]
MPRRQPPAEPVWVSRLVMDAVHFDQLREHGGLAGLRDENTLEAVLARPKQRWHYDPASDLGTLAAAYGWGLVTTHPYRDGNKRTAFLAMVVFLGLNDCDLEATQEEVVTTMLAAAAGQVSEAALADWVRSHLVKLA